MSLFRFVFDIYNAEGKLVTKKDVKKIPLWMPQVIMIRFLLGFIDSYIFCLNFLLINKNHNGAPKKKKVPQQRNSDECGSFVLYFVHLFLEGVPENFDTKSSPSFVCFHFLFI